MLCTINKGIKKQTTLSGCGLLCGLIRSGGANLLALLVVCRQ
ncbi:hypothetical protein BN938_1797 [Mucinivorans hirudinis]|uniref:Uncharacterized protein n=1 Tax=Mucinivorans hirudinis TaxID=1433126 RepID=A0A060R8R3_9BACT|nr:hypothetical protein BN938_1797 [Mucinivorans hirudinis]